MDINLQGVKNLYNTEKHLPSQKKKKKNPLFLEDPNNFLIIQLLICVNQMN